MGLEFNDRQFQSRLIGDFNASNLLAVYGAAVLGGENPERVLIACSSLSSVNGRLDYVLSESGISGLVDYAHTPDALENVLQTLKRFVPQGSKIICVVGCGGNRDKSKRPLMAGIAHKLSDVVILTSDNPRDEDPQSILNEMLEGIKDPFANVYQMVNRKDAIRLACTLANVKDIVLVAGKGHETYQEIKGERFPFDDKAILTETFKSLGK
jgi:UDP-N-acetylmuramoyl-L-alanyl-D-glutamate--2,6-diaminopimelate ligase